MPDFSASRGGMVASRRPSSYSREESDTPSSSLHPDVVVSPAPKPRRSLQFAAVAACVGFLLLQLLPATHVRHPADPTRTWIPIHSQGSPISSFNQVRQQHQQQQQQIRPNGAPAEDDQTGVSSQSGSVDEEYASASQFLRGISQPTTHIFVSTKEMDLRPLLVAINSTAINSRHPPHLHFHLLIPDVLQANWLFKLQHYLHVNIETVSVDVAIQSIWNQTAYQNPKRNDETLSIYKFFLPHIPLVYRDVQRIIYVDSGVVVQGDIEELIHIEMEGRAVAGVEDCFSNDSISLVKLINVLREEKGHVPWLTTELLEPRTCSIDMGVLVIDIHNWNANNLTQSYEWWITELQKGGEVDNRLEILEASLQLTLLSSYQKLDGTWNVHGLSRDELTELERDNLEKLYSQRLDKRPFLSPKTDHAKLLQFSGKYKPWLRKRIGDRSHPVISLCGSQAKECSELWWKYISPHAREFLWLDHES